MTRENAEVIVRSADREISILTAGPDVTVTRARYEAGLEVAGPHIHNHHTDAFYVLEGELTFEVGREAETVTISAGEVVAVPPGVAHSVRNDSGGPARWLTIHADDGGFAGFMRGMRDGVRVEWDIAAVPAGGGRPASGAVVAVAPAYPASASSVPASSRRSSGRTSAQPAATAARSVPSASR
jgi:quercetin dioxygenase-like cupin family protein